MFNTRFNISLPLAASVTALAVAALVTVVYLWGVVTALLGPGAGDVQPDAVLAQYIEEHEQEMEKYTERFNGRSLFYIPPIRQSQRTYSPPPEPVDRTPREETTSPPEPVKTKGPYMGPTVAFAVGSEVWFQPPGPNQPQMSLRVGETAHGVTLKEVRLPAHVVVEWDGYEYTLDLLGRNFPTEWTSTDTRLTKERADAEDSVPGLVRVPESGPMPEQMYNPDDVSTAQPAEDDIPTTRDIEMPRQRPQPMSPDELRRDSEQRELDRTSATAPPAVITGRSADDAPRSATPDTTESVPASVGAFEGPPIPPHILRRMQQEAAAEQETTSETPAGEDATSTSEDADAEVPAADPDAEAAETEATGDAPGRSTADPDSEDESEAPQQPQGADPHADPPAIPPEQRASADVTEPHERPIVGVQGSEYAGWETGRK